MAVINANCVAIYYLEGSTSKRSIAVSDAGFTADAIMINVGGEFRGVANGSGNALLALDLAGAATNSTIEVSNAVDNVARDGAGGMLQETNQTWSVQADGLIQDTGDTGTILFDAARNKNYVVVKWSVGEASAETEYAGQALIDSVTLTGSVDEIATYSVSLTGVDEIYPVA